MEGGVLWVVRHSKCAGEKYNIYIPMERAILGVDIVRPFILLNLSIS